MYNVYNNIIGYDDNNCCFDDNKSVRERNSSVWTILYLIIVTGLPVSLIPTWCTHYNISMWHWQYNLFFKNKQKS